MVDNKNTIEDPRWISVIDQSFTSGGSIQENQLLRFSVNDLQSMQTHIGALIAGKENLLEQPVKSTSVEADNFVEGQQNSLMKLTNFFNSLGSAIKSRGK